MKTGPMTGAEMAEALARLGLSNRAFARLLSQHQARPVSPVTVTRWMADPDKPHSVEIGAGTALAVRQLVALHELGIEI